MYNFAAGFGIAMSVGDDTQVMLLITRLGTSDIEVWSWICKSLCLTSYSSLPFPELSLLVVFARLLDNEHSVLSFLSNVPDHWLVSRESSNKFIRANCERLQRRSPSLDVLEDLDSVTVIGEWLCVSNVSQPSVASTVGRKEVQVLQMLEVCNGFKHLIDTGIDMNANDSRWVPQILDPANIDGQLLQIRGESCKLLQHRIVSIVFCVRWAGNLAKMQS